MLTTLITEENADRFLKVIPDEAFFESELFFGVVDEKTDTACGVLAAGADPDTGLTINFIYVDEDYRHKGAGSALVEGIKSFAKEISISAVSCIHPVSEDGNGIYELLKKCGFSESIMPELSVYEALLSDIKLPKKGANSKVIPLKELSDHQWRSYSSRVDVMTREDENGSTLPLLDRDVYDSDISWVYLNDEDRVMGAILAEASKDTITINELRASAADPGKVILDLLIEAVNATKKKFDKGAKVQMNPYNPDHKLLLEKLSGGKAKKKFDMVDQTYIL